MGCDFEKLQDNDLDSQDEEEEETLKKNASLKEVKIE